MAKQQNPPSLWPAAWGMLNNTTMITIVIAGYAVLMLTIVLSLVAAAARPTPKPCDEVILDARAVRRMAAKPVFKPMPSANSGGTEVLAFEA